jgi:hypothetical protein
MHAVNLAVGVAITKLDAPARVAIAIAVGGAERVKTSRGGLFGGARPAGVGGLPTEHPSPQAKPPSRSRQAPRQLVSLASVHFEPVSAPAAGALRHMPPSVSNAEW